MHQDRGKEIRETKDMIKRQEPSLKISNQIYSQYLKLHKSYHSGVYNFKENNRYNKVLLLIKLSTKKKTKHVLQA